MNIFISSSFTTHIEYLKVVEQGQKENNNNIDSKTISTNYSKEKNQHYLIFE